MIRSVYRIWFARVLRPLFVYGVGVILGGAAQAQSNTQAELEKYRQMLGDGNPAELLVMRGEELWKTARGPRKASLEGCDLGKGPGVVRVATPNCRAGLPTPMP